MYALKCHVVNYYGAIYVLRQLNSDGDASHGVGSSSACQPFTGRPKARVVLSLANDPSDQLTTNGAAVVQRTRTRLHG